MKRLAQVLKKRTFPALTLMVLIALGLGYYLFYVRNRESYFTDRYLRLLAFESGRIEERLSTFESILTNLDQDKPLKKLSPERLGNLAGMERLNPVPPDFLIASKGITRDVRIEGDRVWLYAGWKQGKAAQDVAYRFDPFPPGESEDFETVFVASRDGAVLYDRNQKERRELRVVDVKKILTEDGKEIDLATVAGTTSRLNVLFAGQPYKLFLRPCCRAIWRPSSEPTAKLQDVQRIQLDVRIGSSGTTVPQAAARPEPSDKPSMGNRPALEWVVGGMVRSSTLSTQAWAISFTSGIALLSLFILALLGLPFLRVLAIGPEEKVRVADALWVGFTAVVGVGLLTLLLLDLHAYRAVVDNVDERLNHLANNIEINMRNELKSAWSQLRSFNENVNENVAPGLESCDDLYRAKVIVRDTVGFAGIQYTDFERFTWLDSRGQQCFKRALSFPSDPLVLVKDDRRYWQEASNGREAIEPVFSTATGSRVVVLAMPVPDRPFVGVLGIELSSLSQPVLPPGFGFAVIEDDGDVLFHSEPGRAGYENFFEETDNDRGLRALVYARRGGEVNAPYMGRGHRLWAQPISLPGSMSPLREPPFWTLVTFSDKRDMRAFNVDVLTTAMLFLILYLMVYMIGCCSLRAGNRRYRAGWLWPERKGESRARLHLVLSVFYLLCLLASGVAIALLDGLDLLWFAFVFPWAILLVSYRLAVPKMPPRHRTILAAVLAGTLLLIFWAPGGGVSPDLAFQEEWRKLLLACVCLGLGGFFFLNPESLRFRRDPSRSAYLVAACLLLALTAAVPAAAFFCLSHRAHFETRIKRGQLELALRSQQREARLKRAYKTLLDHKAGPLYREQMETAVAKRLERSWDMYQRFFFATAVPRSLPRPGLVETAREQDKNPESALCLLPAFLQTVLPLYTDDFVRVRHLIEDSDRAGRGPWRWRHDVGGQIEIQGAPLRLSSTVPPVSLQGFRLLWPVSLLLLGSTIFGVALFVARRLFLFGLAMPEPVEPLTAASDSTQNFLLVTTHVDEMAERFRKKGAALIDLREIASHEDLLQCLQRAELVTSPRICLLHLQHHLQNEDHNRLKLELLEELILGRDKTVLILSHVVPTWYLLDRRPVPQAQEADADPDKTAKRQERAEKVREEIEERWRRLLRRFVVWVAGGQVNALQLETDLAAIELKHPVRDDRLQRFLAVAREECGESDQLQALAKGLIEVHLQDLSREMFLEDLRERAEPYYRTLWAICTDEEKVVLVHLAEGGLVNARNIRPLRMLMRRGLVKRAPHFRLMNESFRRFVAKDVCLNEVRVLERQAEASAWGQIRGPLALSLIGMAAFFFVTQREIFDISMAFFGAIAASLPAVFRVLGAVAPGQSKAAP